MYDVLLSSGRPEPRVEERHDRVVVTVDRRIAKREVADFIYKADQTYSLTQKERITLGLIAQQEMLTIIHLTNLLDLKDTVQTRDWLGRLVELQVVRSTGRTKGTKYFVDPELLRKLEFKGRTTLRRIEPHRLRELVLKDLEMYKKASIGEIHGRIGTEIPRRDLQRQLGRLASGGDIGKTGKRRWTRYLWTK